MCAISGPEPMRASPTILFRIFLTRLNTSAYFTIKGLIPKIATEKELIFISFNG
jgi:hypothetical protein